MRQKLMIGLVALALATPAAMANGSNLWLHVKVDGGDETVRVNLPLSLVESVLPAIQIDELDHGRLRIAAIDGGEFDELDLRELWQSIRDLEDVEFVNIQGDHEEVRVYKEGDFLRVDIQGDGDETVDIRIPLEVVGALFSGEPGELDLLAALDALGQHSDGDLVTIRDGNDRVRVWIDDTSKTD